MSLFKTHRRMFFTPRKESGKNANNVEKNA